MVARVRALRFGCWSVLLGTALALGGGCAALPDPIQIGWLADYDLAERQRAHSGEPVLFLFKDGRLERDRPMVRALRDPAVKPLIDPYIKCLLSHEYEPDRRFARQFGVERAPALIVVDGEGLYRSCTGPMTAEEVRAFLTDEDAARRVAVRDAHLHHEVRYDWTSDLAEAEARSQATGRPILVAIYNQFSGEFEALAAILEEPPVFRRFRLHIHCKMGVLWGSHSTERARFGVSDLPALVVVEPDGTSRVLEKPLSARAVVRFARASVVRPQNDPPASPSEPGSVIVAADSARSTRRP